MEDSTQQLIFSETRKEAAGVSYRFVKKRVLLITVIIGFTWQGISSSSMTNIGRCGIIRA